ncbi:GNAT family N-acetyltransferase [Streptomyces sp. WMMB 322]|uniref:GNAT family N-acetyltransferase n=1 Tax=Streptomyces sp. WMMB 322 TaxID=1286821 RepID=UPI0006E17764|nr:GNAT family N-acetyltransferase [Streptomyces sp. WMMB 322]SCK51424.1 Acetyltransferase involved in cellulose biosynthesis, CelD/BcsL family [Streptomyces sp. WMMB 322]
MTSASVCRDPAAFAGLAAEWDGLRRRSPGSTPFQSHAWLQSWWRSYGGRGRLRVVLVRDNGRLVAAAPMMLTHRPLPTLVALGGGITDFCDVLLDGGFPAAAPCLAMALHHASRGALIDLREVRRGAAAEQVYDAWPGPRRRLADSVCLELPGLPMEKLLERLPAASAKRTRQKLRKIDKLGVKEHDVLPSEAAGAVRTLLKLHAMQWEGRGVTPEHLRPRFRAHLERTVERMAESGDATITEYRVDDETVASDITFTSREMVCGYLYGAHPKLRSQRVDITTMLLRHAAAHADAVGAGTLNLLRGAEPHKLRWQAEAVASGRLVMARREMTPALGVHLAQVKGRELAAGAVRHARDAGWLRHLRAGGPGKGGTDTAAEAGGARS